MAGSGAVMALGDVAAKIGLPVFACGHNKRPVEERGFYAARTDRDAIMAAFDRPGADLIGVPTGAPSGIVVVDVDIRDGARGMEWLEANSSTLPETRTHKTRSGGLHLVFRRPDVEIRNSASRIAPGVDVRGDGGYVIWPGSAGYTIADPTEPADMPDWLIRACLKPDPVAPPIIAPPPAANPARARLDGGTAYGLAALAAECDAIRRAPFGSQEHTLNASSLKVGALVAGREIELNTALSDLLAAARSMPSQPGREPWTPALLEQKARRAFADGQAQPRAAPPPRPRPEPPPSVTDDPGYMQALEEDLRMSPAEWHELEQRETGAMIASGVKEPKELLWKVLEPWDEATIPERPWIAPGFFMRRAVSVLSGPGSSGKSSVTIAWSICLALGMPFGRMKPRMAVRVLNYNVEDDEDEQKRRYSAMCVKLGIRIGDWRDRLAIVGPRAVGTLLAPARDGTLLVNTPVMDRLEAFVHEFRPDVMFADPFVELHTAEENDNTAVRGVMARLRSMAVEHNMAIVLLHHARKGASTPGDPDSLRGASAIVGAARVALTLNVMSDEEAKQLSISDIGRNYYFRIDGAKINHAPLGQADWYERSEIELANGDGTVVVWPWRPPSTAPTLNTVAAALQGIADGSPHGPWSPRLSDEPRSFRALARRLGVESPAAQKTLLSELLDRHGVTIGEIRRGGRNLSDTAKGLRTTDGAPHTAEWL